MAESRGEAHCLASPTVAWTFIRDPENWVREFHGYDDHSVAENGSVALRLRGKIGPMTKVTKLQIDITRESAPHVLEFSMRGLTDPLVGSGLLSITPADDLSLVAYQVSLTARGIAAPVLNEFLEFVLPEAVGDLAGRLKERLDAIGAPA